MSSAPEPPTPHAEPRHRLAEVRARLELPLARRAAGLLEGHHHSITKGHGQDFDDLSLYSPGDDVGDIDWKSSARAGIPIMRRFLRQSNLTTVIAADTGREMAARAAGGEPKSEVALLLAAVVTYLATARGDRVALVAGHTDGITARPPRASTQDLEVMLHVLANTYSPTAPHADLAAVLDRVEAAFHRRSLVVIITDDTHPDTEEVLRIRRLRRRHEVLLFTVQDADPVSITAPGQPVTDVTSTWELPSFLHGRADLAAAVATNRALQRETAREFCAGERISHASAGSTDETIAQLIKLLGRHHRARR